MAKSQKHGNREAKKPKAVKLAAAPASVSAFTKGNAAGVDKKRG